MGVDEVRRPAVFIDRDGTLIEQVEILTQPSQVKLLPGVAEAVADLNRRGFLVIGITNQPIMEKGLLSEDGLRAIHDELQKQLSVAGAHFDAFYTCPHRYRPEGQCPCRKPGIKLIEDAEAEFPISREKSWFVGDRLRDVETGKRAGIRTVFVETGGESSDDAFFPDTKADYTAKDLKVAVMLIK